MEELNLGDYFAILRRWKKLFIGTSLAVFAIAMIFVLHWSNYRSTATVQVEQPEISSDAVAPLGSSAREQREALADQRISLLQQKVLSTGSLIEIITKFDLYREEREDTPIAYVAKNMAEKIKLELVSSSVANPSAAKQAPAAIAFNLSFDYSNQLKAQQVTDELVTRFLDEDLKQRRTEAEETSAFLAKQIEGLEQSLSEQEKKIADFQKEQGVTRPESLTFNQQIVAQLTLNLQSLDSQIASNEGNLGALRGQLVAVDPYSRLLAGGQVMTTPSVQLKALQSEYASLTAQYGPEHPDVVKVRHKIEGLQAHGIRTTKQTAQLKSQISDARAKLEEAHKSYGPEHPDVLALRSKLNKLEDQLAKQKPMSDVSGVVSDADNPVYLQFSAQVRSAEEQRKALLQQRADLQAQIDKYHAALVQNPEAQQELAALTRDYENAQMRYRELKSKKLTADMSEQMQKDRRGERLTLINPPELPIRTKPSKKILALGALMASLMAGFGAAAAAQMLRQGLVGIHAIESAVGVAPLVAIPHIDIREETERSMGQRFKRQGVALARRILTRVAPHYSRLDPNHEQLDRVRKGIEQGREWLNKINQS